MKHAMVAIVLALSLAMSGCIVAVGVSKPKGEPSNPEVEQAYEWKGVAIGLGDVSAPGGVKGAGISVPGASAFVGAMKAIAKAGLSFLGRKQIGGEESKPDPVAVASEPVAPAVDLTDYPAPAVPYVAGLYLLMPVPDPEAE